VPDKLNPITTSINGGNTIITVSWSATSSNHGCAVSKYRVKFKKSDSTYAESAECDGSNASVISAKSCTINVSSLSGSPYTLSSSTLVVAQVEAYNEIGYSDPSNDNTSGANMP
jgi:hypothetical protein